MKFWDVRELNINELRRVVIRYCLPLSPLNPLIISAGFYFYKKFPKYYQSVFGGQRIIPVGSDWSDMSDEIYPKVILL